MLVGNWEMGFLTWALSPASSATVAYATPWPSILRAKNEETGCDNLFGLVQIQNEGFDVIFVWNISIFYHYIARMEWKTLHSSL